LAVFQPRKCLICSIPIAECHLGIDSCRACSVFYKRVLISHRTLKCKGSDDKCIKKEPTTSCRKCRFTRFAEVMSQAGQEESKDVIDEDDDDATDNVNAIKMDELLRLKFVDHNTFMLEQTSQFHTPLLDRIRSAYSIMCQARKSGEMATKPTRMSLTQGDYDGSNVQFLPATYSMVIPNSRLLVSSFYDFAGSSFPDFRDLSVENKVDCVTCALPMVALIDSEYRESHYFQNDPEILFQSYTTTISENSLEGFFDDCSSVQNSEEAIRYDRFRKRLQLY
ncbi:hypothetical protein PMAYCL1PPCAC_05675, partial [Pristionchus mayeri]